MCSRIPYFEIADYLQSASEGKRTIVTVGLSDGEREKSLEDDHHVRNMLLVGKIDDEKKYFRRPDYSDVSFLVKERTDLVGECVLFLPSQCENQSGLDHEAIQSLKPKCIVTIGCPEVVLGGNRQYDGWRENQDQYELKYTYSMAYGEFTHCLDLFVGVGVNIDNTLLKNQDYDFVWDDIPSSREERDRRHEE
jgi:hypothetical protein